MVAPTGSRSDTGSKVGQILLVEDHADTAEVLGQLLKMRGYEVRVAATLAEARAVCHETRFDFVLCDIGLPDGNGLEFAPVARAACPGAKLIALTAYAMPEDVEAAETAGFDAHVAKPVTIQSLLQHLDSPARSPSAMQDRA